MFYDIYFVILKHISSTVNILGLVKRIECLNLHSFGMHLKLNVSLRSLTVTLTLLFYACTLVQSKHVVNNVGVLGHTLQYYSIAIIVIA